MAEEAKAADGKVREYTPWEDLWGRVRLTFSDEDEERYRKRCALRDKNFRKHGLSVPPVDEDALKTAMVEYARTMKYVEAIRVAGVTAVDLEIADQYCPEVMMVREFVRRMRNKARDERRSDDVDRWEDALDAKATDHGGRSKADSRAAMFLLERVERRTFGKEPPKEEEGPKKLAGGGIQVNVIGDAALKLLTRGEGQKAGGVFVDV